MEQQNMENVKVTFDFVKTPITQIADYIIIAGSKANASDIHFDPRETGMMVRFRTDGDLQDYSFIPKAYERNLTTRLKLLANMNITESRLPQDGAIKGMFGDTYLDMRVSCLPLNEGEKIVIRILDYTRSLQGIDSLGFHPDNLKKLKRMMQAPNGIILVTGATGSGKSTTTYSILQGLNNPETNIITVEDPIEMNIQGINQVQVNSEIGMTFAAALRSILRQDPNVILIGEIRDSETAQIAVRSAITGHLVLSTIHTNNSLSTIERLMDMDVERYLLSTALTGIISQRLAKGICPKCRYQRKTTPYEQKIFRNFLKLDVKTIWDANPNGCDNCRKGYKGRIAIQEVLELDDEIRAALTIENLSKDDLKKMVYTNKIITMLQDALIKCINGETSFEEVYRVIEMENEEGEDYSAELTAVIHDSLISKPAENANANIVYNNINTENVTISGNNLTDAAPTVGAPDSVMSMKEGQLPNIVNNLQQVQQPATEIVSNAQQPVNVEPAQTNVTETIPEVTPTVEATIQPEQPTQDETNQQPINEALESPVEAIPEATPTIDETIQTGQSEDNIVQPNINENTVESPIEAVTEQVPMEEAETQDGIDEVIPTEEATAQTEQVIQDETNQPISEVVENSESSTSEQTTPQEPKKQDISNDVEIPNVIDEVTTQVEQPIEKIVQPTITEIVENPEENEVSDTNNDIEIPNVIDEVNPADEVTTQVEQPIDKIVQPTITDIVETPENNVSEVVPIEENDYSNNDNTVSLEIPSITVNNNIETTPVKEEIPTEISPDVVEDTILNTPLGLNSNEQTSDTNNSDSNMQSDEFNINYDTAVPLEISPDVVEDTILNTPLGLNSSEETSDTNNYDTNTTDEEVTNNVQDNVVLIPQINNNTEVENEEVSEDKSLEDNNSLIPQINETEENDELAPREPYGSDAVDITQPILEEIPRLSTKIEYN